MPGNLEMQEILGRMQGASELGRFACVGSCTSTYFEAHLPCVRQVALNGGQPADAAEGHGSRIMAWAIALRSGYARPLRLFR